MRLCVSDACRRELRGFVRAFSGAFLFGIPLLYTMEMWWLGETSRPRDIFLVLGVMLVANFWFAAAVGFRNGSSLGAKLEQTVDAVAVGTVAALVVLLTLNEIRLDQAPLSILGKVVFQALPLSLGASLANAVFVDRGDRTGDEQSSGESPGAWRTLLNDVGATAIGAIFVAASVAPTEEVPMIAGRMDLPHVLALIGLSLVIGYIIVFASGFDRTSGTAEQDHPFQHPLTETTLSYLVSLIVALGVLLLTQQLVPTDAPANIMTQTIVLGLPATIGGAAGRLAI